jgi:hypothetical protein
MSNKHPDALFDELAALQASQALPPVAQWHPEREGTIDIRIDGDGQWHHEGQPIKRHAMVKLFSSILRRDPDGYCLVTPAERLMIQVDDVPFMAVEMAIKGAGSTAELLFRTNVDDHVVVDAEHPLWVLNAAERPQPYVRVRDALDARLTRAVFYELVEASTLEAGECCIYSRGQRFALGRAD